MKYTTGPWTVAAGPTYCAIRTDARVIADMRLVGLHYNKADAHLICAAPDLLEALQDLFDADMEHVLMGDGKDDQIEAIAKARAAIAKATRSET
jgi:hypothetical protein